ncbi:MAG: hypothetical protein JNL11_02840 [Bdellovibrionaceae bacterium]|nr:hypothetical protein [Pseudobdellovibrionaceae bacterium]
MKFWEISFLVPFFLGLYLFIKTPLNSRYGGPTWSDPLLGFGLILITAVYFYLAHYSGQILIAQESGPCGPRSRQMECYNLTQDICVSAWTSSSGDCEEKVEQIRKTRPSFLSGAFLYTCVGRNFDKMMHYNRKTEISSRCQAYFQKIDRRD